MTAEPTPIRALLDRDETRLADDRRAVLRAYIEDALGPLAGRATCDIEELKPVFPTWGRSTLYKACRSGVVPSTKVGRRIVVHVPGLVSLLLSGSETTKAGCGEPASVLTQRLGAGRDVVPE